MSNLSMIKQEFISTTAAPDVLWSLTATDLLRRLTRTTQNHATCWVASVWSKQWAAACGWCVLGDSAKNRVKSSELKTHHCQSPGDINNMLAPLRPFIIARLAITGSLPPASKKNPAHLHSPQFGICHHNYCRIVLKVKANIINRAARHERKTLASCTADVELSGSS